MGRHKAEEGYGRHTRVGCRNKRQTLKYGNGHLILPYSVACVASITKISRFYPWESPPSLQFLLPTSLVKPPSLLPFITALVSPVTSEILSTFYNPQAHICNQSIVFFLFSAKLTISPSNLKSFMVFHCLPKQTFTFLARL